MIRHKRSPIRFYTMQCKRVYLCVRKGKDQCNINVSISTKLSSSSSEWHWSPRKHDPQIYDPALVSLSSLRDNIKSRFRHLYHISPGVKMNMTCKVCVCWCIFLQGSSKFLINTILLHHPKHATTASLTDQTDKINAFSIRALISLCQESKPSKLLIQEQSLACVELSIQTGLLESCQKLPEKSSVDMCFSYQKKNKSWKCTSMSNLQCPLCSPK